jgi:hypothetical protein
LQDFCRDAQFIAVNPRRLHAKPILTVSYGTPSSDRINPLKKKRRFFDYVHHREGSVIVFGKFNSEFECAVSIAQRWKENENFFESSH